MHKANKNNEFIQQFFSSESLLRIHESITTHVFGAADAGVGVLMFSIRGMHTHASWHSHECAWKTDTEEKKLLNKVFFVHKIFS